MRKKHLNKIPLVLVMLVACRSLQAQNSFQYKASLGNIKQTGFYKITMLPQWVALCKADFSDLRIMDDRGNFIPYLLKSDLPVFSTQHFIEFPVLFNQKLKDSSSELIIENSPGHPINSLLLIIKNTSAYRTATLSGSDDRQKWFVINENILLEEAANNSRSENYMQSISFPLSNYRFFKVIINDKGMLPVNILKAGIFTNTFTYGKYLPIPDPVIKQKDSGDKHSYITVSFKDFFQVDRLQFSVESPALYKRTVSISDPSGQIRQALARVEITPSENLFSIPPAKTKILLVDISNKDDQPLVIKNIQAFQINQYILSYLEAGKSYAMLAGDSAAAPPEYDLKYFADTLSVNMQEIEPGQIQKQTTAHTAPDTTINKHAALFLWGVIILILLLLISLSYKMVKAISKKEKDGRL